MTKARDIASAIPAPSTVSSAELGYLDGVSSAIQTQLDAKTAKSTLSTTGDIYYASSANTPARLGIGSAGNVLTVASGIPSWAAPAGGDFTKTTSGTFSVSATNFAIDNCFSSTYKNYKVIFTFTSATQSPARWGVYFRFRTGGTDNTVTNYRYTNLQYAFSGGALEQDSGNDVSYSYVTSLDNGLAQLTLDFINPFATNVTYVSGFQSNKTKALHEHNLECVAYVAWHCMIECRVAINSLCPTTLNPKP